MLKKKHDPKQLGMFLLWTVVGMTVLFLLLYWMISLEKGSAHEATTAWLQSF